MKAPRIFRRLRDMIIERQKQIESLKNTDSENFRATLRLESADLDEIVDVIEKLQRSWDTQATYNFITSANKAMDELLKKL